MTDTEPAEIADLTFEDALRKLEAIVGKLEAGEAPLDESIKLYEQGGLLRAHCEKQLKSAQERIEKIQLDADGKPAGTEPLDPE